MVQSSLGETDLLLIIEMCNEGIEKCGLRDKEHLRQGNTQEAEWNRRIRDRYAHLKGEILAELELRRRSITAHTGEVLPEARSKPESDPAK